MVVQRTLCKHRNSHYLSFQRERALKMNFEIPKLAWLKAVMLAAAKKDPCYCLNGVMVRNGEMAATNGHMALIIKSDDIKSDGKYIIDNNTLKMIVTSHNGIKDDNRVEVIDSVTTTGINKISIITVGGKFPDINKVIPQDPSGEIAHFNAEYLLACQKANQEFLGRNNVYIKLQHNGKAGAKFDSEDEDGNKLVGVVMPVRI